MSKEKWNHSDEDSAEDRGSGDAAESRRTTRSSLPTAETLGHHEQREGGDKGRPKYHEAADFHPRDRRGGKVIVKVLGR